MDHICSGGSGIGGGRSFGTGRASGKRAEAVMASYQVAPAALKLILAPYTAPPMPASGVVGGGGLLPGGGGITQEQSIDCWDESVLRDEPDWRLPRYRH